MPWTWTNQFSNNTQWDLIPKQPSQATWFGWNTAGPKNIPAKSVGEAGKFAAANGAATGITGISVYTLPDNASTIQILFMMPYKGPNQVKVGLFSKNDPVDQGQVERMWNDAQFTPGTTFDLAVGGANYTFTLTGSVDPQAYDAVAQYELSAVKKT